MPSSFIGVQEPAGASWTARLDTWTIDRGGTTIGREVIVLGGSASDGLLFGTSGAPGAGGLALPVWPVNASGALSTANPLAVFLQGSTATVTVQGNVSAAISGNTTAVLSTAGLGGSTANPLYVSQAGQLSQIYQGTTALTPQFSSVNVTASGIVSIVASATGAVYLLAAQLSAKTSCTIQWMEATTSGLTGVQSLAGDGGFVLPYSPVGWFKTASGLQLSLSVQGSSGGVGGSIVYARPGS